MLTEQQVREKAEEIAFQIRKLKAPERHVWSLDEAAEVITRALLAASREGMEAAAKMVEQPAAFRDHIPIGCFLSFEKMAAAIRAAMPSPADTDGREGGEG